MKKFRFGVFETNSSSTHSLSIGVLSQKEEENSFLFDRISIEPQHFGYDDIVAAMPFTNNFPDMSEICKGCEYLSSEKDSWNDTRYECRNPNFGKYTVYNWWSFDTEKCELYTNNVKRIVDQLSNNQTPDERACALLTSIVCLCWTSRAELIHKYFDNLFSICKEVYYRNIKFEKEKNTVEYWENAMFHGNWGDYDSQCWMETHETRLTGKEVEDIVTDTLTLKRFLFGRGSYAGGDRDG